MASEQNKIVKIDDMSSFMNWLCNRIDFEQTIKKIGQENDEIIKQFEMFFNVFEKFAYSYVNQGILPDGVSVTYKKGNK